MTASQAQQTRRVGLCLNPLDVLFFRDGRPFEAASRAYGGLPLPRTFAGALRTACSSRLGSTCRACDKIGTTGRTCRRPAFF